MGIILYKVKLPKIMFRYVIILKSVDTLYQGKNTKMSYPEMNWFFLRNINCLPLENLVHWEGGLYFSHIHNLPKYHCNTKIQVACVGVGLYSGLSRNRPTLLWWHLLFLMHVLYRSVFNPQIFIIRYRSEVQKHTKCFFMLL